MKKFASGGAKGETFPSQTHPPLGSASGTLSRGFVTTFFVPPPPPRKISSYGPGMSVLSDLSFHTVGSSAPPVSTALQQLMDKCQLTTSQVNGEIQQEDVPCLAAYFDSVEFYVDMMNLTTSEQSDVRLKKIESNHLAMIECLKIWKRKKLSQATFGVLLEMLVKLKKGEIATQVCQYLKVSVCVCPLISVYVKIPAVF